MGTGSLHPLRSALRAAALSGALLACSAAAGAAQDAAAGQAVYDRACAACHAGGSNAPTRDALRQLGPEAIITALTTGKMRDQGATLSEAERRAVAEFLAERAIGPATAPAAARCAASPPVTDPAIGPSWNGWGNGPANTRFARAGGLSAADLPRLKLQWAFGYAGVSAARAQPTLAGGRLFVASENGEVHALDPRTGCTHWTFKAQAGVRTALLVAPYRAPAGAGFAVYFGDVRAVAYAVDAATGQQVWAQKVDDHQAAGITGALAYHDGRVFVPIQGLNEEGYANRPGYECCTFRGAVIALDAGTGELVWKTYMVDQPRPRGKTKDGIQAWGPAGGGIWAAPTVDERRGLVYVATGNGYADPPQPLTDAIVALDARTGQIRWSHQMTPNDNWAMGCGPKNPDNPRCPEVLGPDYDFSASPRLSRPAVAICSSCRRSPASSGPSIPIGTAPSCGSSGSGRAAGSAGSGVRPWTTGMPTWECPICCPRTLAACAP